MLFESSCIYYDKMAIKIHRLFLGDTYFCYDSFNMHLINDAFAFMGQATLTTAHNMM